MRTLIKNGRVVTAVDDYVADIFIDGEVAGDAGFDVISLLESTSIAPAETGRCSRPLGGKEEK